MAWFAVARKHELKIVYRAIEKKRFERWMHRTFGSGIAINPHVAAFPLVARVIDDWLKALPDSPLGIFISDENKEIVRDVEKSITVLRATDGALRLCQIIEKGFFIDSSKSVILQLCDVCALTLRKSEEAKAGGRDNALYHSGTKLLEPLIHRGTSPSPTFWHGSRQKQKRSGQGQCPKSVRTGSFWSLMKYIGVLSISQSRSATNFSCHSMSPVSASI